MQPTKKGKVAIILFVVACLMAAWISRPTSLKRRLEARGVILDRIPRDDIIKYIAYLKPRAGTYEMPQLGEGGLSTALREAGFQNQFGKGKTVATLPGGSKFTGFVQLWTRGYHLPPLVDYDRVWIVEYGSTKTVCFDPDLQ